MRTRRVREKDQDRMAEDKGQNVKINLPTKTDDPKLSVGLVMVGGAPSVNSIYAALPTQFVLPFEGRREKRRHGIKRPPGPCGSSTYVPLPKPNNTHSNQNQVSPFCFTHTNTLFLFSAPYNCLSHCFLLTGILVYCLHLRCKKNYKN